MLLKVNRAEWRFCEWVSSLQAKRLDASVDHLNKESILINPTTHRSWSSSSSSSSRLRWRWCCCMCRWRLLSSTDDPLERPALLRDDTLARCDISLELKILLRDDGTGVAGAVPSSSMADVELGLAEPSSSRWRCCPSSSSSFSGRSVRAASSPSSEMMIRSGFEVRMLCGWQCMID